MTWRGPYLGDIFQARGEFDVVDDGIDGREGGEDAVAFEAFSVGGVGFGSKVSCAPCRQPSRDDDGVGGGFGVGVGASWDCSGRRRGRRPEVGGEALSVAAEAFSRRCGGSS